MSPAWEEEESAVVEGRLADGLSPSGPEGRLVDAAAAVDAVVGFAVSPIRSSLGMLGDGRSFSS